IKTKREDSGMSHTRKEERKQTGGCYRFYGNVPVAATTSLEVSVRWWYIRNIFQLQALKSPHIDVRSSDLDDDTVPFLYKHVELRGRVRGGHASSGGGVVELTIRATRNHIKMKTNSKISIFTPNTLSTLN
ncbi:hypothetical protein V1477_000214, partial [Vespula maculifrons]